MRNLRTLWVTNDFPPRTGGIEMMISNLVSTRPVGTARVLASPHPEAANFDREFPAEVVRVHRRPLLPTPGVARTVRNHVAAFKPDVVVFGSAWPLGELGGKMPVPTVAITHGREAGMVRFGQAEALRRIARNCDVVTVLSEYTATQIAPVIDRYTALHRLPGGVDTSVFKPEGPTLRSRFGLAETEPVAVCISRLVPRKGQDLLIRIWDQVRAAVPGARLLILGEGPLRRKLDRAAGQGVVIGGPVAWDDLPAAYRTGDVFVMPCRTRHGGLDVEGLGLVFLEAQACGIPVVVGDSGGAPETAARVERNLVVDGRDQTAVKDAIVSSLLTREERNQTKQDLRRYVVTNWDWEIVGTRLSTALDLAVTTCNNRL